VGHNKVEWSEVSLFIDLKFCTVVEFGRLYGSGWMVCFLWFDSLCHCHLL